MYSRETIRKAVVKLYNAINNYSGRDINSYRMCISDGNKKIGHVLNVSLAPIITCRNCAECMYYCYDIKAVMAYPSCLDARARNTALFQKNRDEFFSRLHQRMVNRKKNKYLRFHVSGEIVDIDHFSRMVETAKKFTEFRIWTYTKNYYVVNEYVKRNGGTRETSIPKNFSVMFSEWQGMPMKNPYGFPTFRCIMEGETEPDNVFKCPGNCNVCKACNCGCIKGEDVYCNEH